MGYNVQTTVDEKNKLTIDFKVTNENDSKAMGIMLRRAEVILGTSEFTGLYDKGYHTGSELKAGIKRGVHVMVAIPDISSASMAPDPAYNVSKFLYDKDLHQYTCPQGQILTTNGNWYKKDRNAKGRKHTAPIQVQHFKTSACKNCPVLNLCTKNTEGRGRVIERTEFQDFVDINKKNIEADPKTYKKRQAIIEHTYGIIKRQWGFYFISTKKGIRRAEADAGIMFACFNLRRLFNIVDKKGLTDYLGGLEPIFNSFMMPFFALCDFVFLKAQLQPLKEIKI